MRKLLRIYKKVLIKIGRVNTLLILSLVYWLVLPFFALFFKLRQKQFSASSWREKEPALPCAYERQF